MRQINVNLINGNYQIVMTKGFDDLNSFITKSEQRCVIITDSNVKNLYADKLISVINKLYSKSFLYEVCAGESSKNINECISIYKYLQENRIDRNDVICSLGGGVVGDLTGFVASTYLRGLKIIHFPTSLLAQVDSSVGGKTGIDFNNLKNSVGTFYQPSLVYINYDVLVTLNQKEIKNGLVEVLVHAIIKDPNLFEFLEVNIFSIINNISKNAPFLIYENCKIKAELVRMDEKDHNERAILNFGHTIGHAVEAYYNYQYTHGECVAVGIVGAVLLAQRLNLIISEDANRIFNLLTNYNLSININNMDIDKILNLILLDKKTIASKFNFIVPLKIGTVKKYTVNDLNLIKDVLLEVKKVFCRKIMLGKVRQN